MRAADDGVVPNSSDCLIQIPASWLQQVAGGGTGMRAASRPAALARLRVLRALDAPQAPRALLGFKSPLRGWGSWIFRGAATLATSMWRRDGDLNPGDREPVWRFSRPLHSAALPSLREKMTRGTRRHRALFYVFWKAPSLAMQQAPLVVDDDVDDLGLLGLVGDGAALGIVDVGQVVCDDLVHDGHARLVDGAERRVLAV